MKTRVSVTITTKNESANIERCIRSIALQDVPVRIVVVDNGSTDDTKKIARKYTRFVYDKGPERSAQRNYGMIKRSATEFVMFIDADMILSSGVIRACLTAMAGTKADALHIPEIVLGRNFFSRVRRFERSFYDGTVIDGARFFRRSAFIRAGGFDETMSGPEDWDIDKKIKARGAIALLDDRTRTENVRWNALFGAFLHDRGVDHQKQKTCIFHNEAEFELSKYLKKKSYYIGSFDTYTAKWGAEDADVKKQLGMYYRMFGVFTESWKWTRLIAHPLLSCGMYFLRALVGVRFVFRPKK
ncbi:MAG: glycosyltransferase [Spirochaetota bacterium]